MSLVEVLALAVGLAMDAFTVSLSAGASRWSGSRRFRFRLAFHFGLFQFLMPVVGWYTGSRIAHLIIAFDHWVAFGLLALIGVRMIRPGRGDDDPSMALDPSRGWSLVMLSVATSIDALAVGLSLAFLQVNIWYPSVVIGIVTASMSLCGLLLGHRLGQRFGRTMEIVGGSVLILIGLKILSEHLSP